MHALTERDLVDLNTVEDFMFWVEGRPERWEFYDGLLRMMAPASPNHGAIEANVAIALGTKLRGGPCRVRGPSAGVKIDNNVLSPDVSVSCTEPVDGLVVEPVVVVEVISPSSASYDRGRKREIYESCSSLRHYVMLEQRQARAVLGTRRGSGWLYTEYEGLDATLKLDGLGGLKLSLAELYDGVAFE